MHFGREPLFRFSDQGVCFGERLFAYKPHKYKALVAIEQKTRWGEISARLSNFYQLFESVRGQFRGQKNHPSKKGRGRPWGEGLPRFNGFGSLFDKKSITQVVQKHKAFSIASETFSFSSTI